MDVTDQYAMEYVSAAPLNISIILHNSIKPLK